MQDPESTTKNRTFPSNVPSSQTDLWEETIGKGGAQIYIGWTPGNRQSRVKIGLIVVGGCSAGGSCVATWRVGVMNESHGFPDVNDCREARDFVDRIPARLPLLPSE